LCICDKSAIRLQVIPVAMRSIWPGTSAHRVGRNRACSFRITARVCATSSSGRPGALRRRAPLRTGLAPFNASGSSKPGRSDDRLVHRSAPRWGGGRPQVHSPRPMVGRLVCPLVEGSSSTLFSWAHLTTSARFRAGPQGSVSGRLSATIGRRALVSTVAVSRCLSAAGVGFLVILFPPGS
jgi:hypothetical protein